MPSATPFSSAGARPRELRAGDAPAPGGLSSLFLTRHYPSLADALRQGAARPLQSHMRSVISSDRVMSKLDLSHPGEQVYFGNDEGDTDRGPVWKLTGQSEPVLRETIHECPVVDPSWFLANKPYNWLMVLVCKWYAEHSDEQDQRAAVMFFALPLYASLNYKYWTANGGFQPNAMAYAMNDLSEKFTLKQQGTMFKAIIQVAWRSHTYNLGKLRAGDDKSLWDYYVSIWSRLNGMVKSLASQYYKVLGDKSYLNQAREHYDDGEPVERVTEGGRVSGTADRLAEVFVGEPSPPRALELAAQMADVPRQSLTLAINGIRATDGHAVREVFALILELFFEERKVGPEDVKTRGFLAFALAVYARSNTKDGRVERIKTILDELLKRCSEAYMRTNREATRGNFRKSIYVYLIIFMQMRA
jgi:hypothetical protein